MALAVIHAYFVTLSVAGHPAGGGDAGVGNGDGVIPPATTVLLARVVAKMVVAAGTMVGAVEVAGGAGGACIVDEAAGGYNTTQDNELVMFEVNKS